MSRYIDATQLQKRVENNIRTSILSEDFYQGAMWVLKQIRQFRRDKNVARVVRCKDCIHHTDEEIGMVYCPAVIGGWVANDWYCGDGERCENDL